MPPKNRFFDISRMRDTEFIRLNEEAEATVKESEFFNINSATTQKNMEREKEHFESYLEGQFGVEKEKIWTADDSMLGE
jgi:hypothetical protein